MPGLSLPEAAAARPAVQAGVLRQVRRWLRAVPADQLRGARLQLRGTVVNNATEQVLLDIGLSVTPDGRSVIAIVAGPRRRGELLSAVEVLVAAAVVMQGRVRPPVAGGPRSLPLAPPPGRASELGGQFSPPQVPLHVASPVALQVPRHVQQNLRARHMSL